MNTHLGLLNNYVTVKLKGRKKLKRNLKVTKNTTFNTLFSFILKGV